MDVKEIFKTALQKMEKSLGVLQQELGGLRTGKASPALLELIRVEAYGTLMPVNQVASITAPDPRLLVIQPWDKGILPNIEKVLRSSDLGLNPTSDGTVIRVPIPPLNEERRKELVRLLHRVAEEGRVAIRNERREANEHVKALEKKGDLSEDEARRTQEEIQRLTDEFMEKIDGLLKKKEKEILEV